MYDALIYIKEVTTIASNCVNESDITEMDKNKLRRGYFEATKMYTLLEKETNGV